MKKIGIGLGALALTLLVAGCGKTGNLFSFTHRADAAGTTDLLVLTSDAMAAVEAGDYAKAEELYQRAVDTNPTSSEARIGVVNAVTKQIQQQGFDLLSLTTSFTNQKAPVFYEMVSAGAPSAYRAAAPKAPSGYWLFSKDPTKDYKISMSLLIKLYKAFITHFVPICTGQTDLSLAKVPSIVYANLSFGYLMRGVIKVVDQDENGQVDYVVFYRNSPGKYEVYLTSQCPNETSDPTGSPLTSGNGILTAEKEAAAKADLDNAITYMTAAKNYSQDKTATLWTTILDILTKAKTMIDELQ
jgi:hypothetical protein